MIKLAKDNFERYLLLGLVVVGIYLLFFMPQPELRTISEGSEEIHFFFHPTCPHCKEQKPFNDMLAIQYPELKFIYHDTSDPAQNELLREKFREFGIDQGGVPFTYMGDSYQLGFSSAETTGKKIEAMIEAHLNGVEVSSLSEQTQSTVVDLKLFDTWQIAKVDALDFSLPVLAIILGLVDGFNPCAMWVLVYLISLIMSINDRRKIWLLVGSFVLASGILYFLFMTAWLNVFLIIGYMTPLTIIIGLGALYVGITNVREFMTTKGALQCEVGDVKSKRRTMNKMEAIVKAPLTWATVGGIVVLAFIVNSIEFACSAALPAIFAHVLAISGVSTFAHYMYILLYVMFFMLDDLIIFSLAAFAISTSIGDKYAKYCKLIGGAVLIILGLMMALRIL